MKTCSSLCLWHDATEALPCGLGGIFTAFFFLSQNIYVYSQIHSTKLYFSLLSSKRLINCNIWELKSGYPRDNTRTAMCFLLNYAQQDFILKVHLVEVCLRLFGRGFVHDLAMGISFK